MSVLAAGTAGLTRLAYLADDTDVGDETHKAGPIAVVVIIVLCVACFILFRSMSKHLRRVREEFPGTETPGPEGGASAAGEPTGPDEMLDSGREPGPVASGPSRAAPKSRTPGSDE
ncbi:hypothetical protein ACXR2U_13395 [Jatrophihabitans sp. YIM 134969]